MLQKVFLTTLVMTILAVLLISPLQSRASEEESGQPVCTITLRMQYNGQDLDSGELGIYTVARLLTDGSDYRYVYTGQFKNFENFTQDRMTAEKCLLYVALTRAQKGAFISGYGKMSELIN